MKLVNLEDTATLLNTYSEKQVTDTSIVLIREPDPTQKLQNI